MRTRSQTKNMKEWNDFILNNTNRNIPPSYTNDWKNYSKLLLTIGWQPISPNDYYQEKETYLSLSEHEKTKSINEIYKRIRKS